MRKWLLVILPLFFWLQSSLRGQDMVGCLQLLEDAKEAYAAGMVELVPELLNPCIESGLSGAPKIEAYKLVINAYLFDYLPDQADALMDKFLDENPSYKADPTDPAEFTLLLEAHQKKRAEEAAALAELERARLQAEIAEQKRIAEEERLQGKQKKRVTSNTESPRMGFVLGFNSTFAAITEPFSTGDPLQDNGDFSAASGLLLGGVADFPLGRTVEFSFELLWNRTRLHYTASPNTFTSYALHEAQSRLQLPLSLAVYLNPYGQTRVYFRFGFMTDYLMSASASAIRSYTETGSSFLRDVELEKFKITDARSRMNLYGLLGLGVRIPLQNSFLFMEARYNAGLFLANREENRYDNGDLIWMIYHVDSNFRINQLDLNVGMSWNLNK
jgi:hypothetical protein